MKSAKEVHERVESGHKELGVPSGGALSRSLDHDFPNRVCTRVQVRRLERKKSGVAATQHKNEALVCLPFLDVMDEIEVPLSSLLW